jgi:hypothetical protein
MKTSSALIVLLALAAVADARISVFPSTSPGASPAPSPSSYPSKPLLDRFSSARWGAVIEATHDQLDSATFQSACWDDATGAAAESEISWSEHGVLAVLTGLEPATGYTCEIVARAGDDVPSPALVVDFSTKA